MADDEQEDITTDADDTTTDAPDTDAPEPDAAEPDFSGTDAADTDEADTDAPSTVSAAASKTKSEAAVSTVPKKKKEKKKRKPFSMEKCMEKRWKCDNMPNWEIFMNAFLEDQVQQERDDIFKHRKPATISKFPRVQSEEDLATPHKCLPLNAFQFQDKQDLPNKMDRSKMVRIWKNMRANHPVHISKSDVNVHTEVKKTDSGKWPGLWPCTKRNLVAEMRERRRQERKRRKDLFPCEPDDEKDGFDDTGNDYSDRKELGHARIPPVCPTPVKELQVDRAAGENPGLVDGDYIVFELPSKGKIARIYADVCIHGLVGMHLPELGLFRQRRKTWKFCFYQAIVALLAKTQLRYKYAWSANIDYIYDHAWMLYTHMGMTNVNAKHRLDDIVVYNYKYSIEIELVRELNDVPVITGVGFDYEEPNLARKRKLERKNLMNVQLELGAEKMTDDQRTPVHKGLKKLEDWFDKLKIRYRNCIYRTSRFCVAFWKDNLFWYLYNPYRCDQYGFWNDNGFACIVKFCTRESLRRHLMILTLRAYVYEVPKSTMQKHKEATAKTEPVLLAEDAPAIAEPEEGPPWEEECYTVQIFQVTHLCCQIHNLRLLQRMAPKPAQRLVKMKTIDDCPFDPLDTRDACMIEQEEGDIRDAIEKPTWLKLYKITWAKCTPVAQKKKSKDTGNGKMRWHQYVVEESNKLFSLWGELHITDGMFDRENRGMQTYACYVVCAGMTRIMAPEYWSSKTLDVIAMCGDRYYTHSKLEAQFKATKNEYSHVNCWNRYLTSHFTIGETMFEANVLPAICGRLYSKSCRYLWQTLEQMFLKYKFGILTCESSCLGIFKFCGSYYVCDVNSVGPPLFSYGEGAVYLLRATYFYKFITVLVLTVGSPECSQFAVNPIEILKVIEVGPTTLPIGRPEKKRDKRIAKIECPFDEEKKKQMRKWKTRRQETAKTIDKMCCKGGAD
ncbi:uncharacterized protein LOC117218419 [Megalopta genalis]|uniref:uncharacterized protein LOC117218419 n=1 Tax=Megalopta genalis TaxID=115081 RepID=UPI0014436105|nr:uncharacterized protein LOC117218419 [Megalopta genalis]